MQMEKGDLELEYRVSETWRREILSKSKEGRKERGGRS